MSGRRINLTGGRYLEIHENRVDEITESLNRVIRYEAELLEKAILESMADERLHEFRRIIMEEIDNRALRAMMGLNEARDRSDRCVK